MAKGTKIHKMQLSVDSVLRSHGGVNVRQLIALIHRVNPSGANLADDQTARRYTQKNQLQSLLVRRFGAELDIRAEPTNPTVVSLYHRPTGLDACHAVITALDEDVRSWVQREVDLQAFQEPEAPEGRPSPRRQAAGDIDMDNLPVHELIRQGREAIDNYDYELAYQALMTAFDNAGGSTGAAAALLTLLVDTMAADEEAVSLAARMAADAVADAEVRLLLGIAAARLGHRDQALQWLLNHPSPRAADALVALARQALAAGDWEGAARDLAAARACAPTHAELDEIAQRIASTQAIERLPLEQELSQLVQAGQVKEARQRARALLRRFPESDAAQRALREIERQEQLEYQRRLVADAEEAIQRQELTLALSLLRQAAALGIYDDLCLVHDTIAHLEAEERGRQDQKEIERVVGLFSTDKVPEGLLAYAGLDSRVRSGVRERLSLPDLTWLDETEVQGTGARARAGVAAVLALYRASQTVESDPEGARQGIAAHAKILQSVRYAAEVTERAERLIEDQRRATARSKVAAAQGMVEERNLVAARNLLKEVSPRDLPLEEQQNARLFALAIERALEQERRVSTMQTLIKDGEIRRARDVAQQIVDHAEGEAKKRWSTVLNEIKAKVRRTFGMRIFSAEDFPQFPLWDFDVWFPHRTTGVLRTLLPDGRAILAQSHDLWVFLRTLDVQSGQMRQMIVLKTEISLGLLRAEVFGDTLVLVGGYGDILEISTKDWDVMNVYRLVPLEERQTRPASTQGVPEGQEPVDVMLDAVMDIQVTQDRRFFWVFRRRPTEVYIDVVDRFQTQPNRKIPMTSIQTFIAPVPGTNPPRVVVLNNESDTFTTYEPNGVQARGNRFLPAIARSIVALPGGHDFFLLTSDLQRDAEGHQHIGWAEVSQAGSTALSEINILDGFSTYWEVGVAADLNAGRVYLRFTNHHGENELMGFEQTETGIKPIFRVPVSDRTLFVEDRTGGVVALCVHEDGIELTPLGRTPPVFREGPMAGGISTHYLTACYVHCDRPVGQEVEAINRLATAMRQEGTGRIQIRIREAKEQGDVPYLFDLTSALYAIGLVQESRKLDDWVRECYSEHPAMRLAHARAMNDGRLWQLVVDYLLPVDPNMLEQEIRRHCHHLLANALLHLGQMAEAHRVLVQGETYPGPCDLKGLFALATPLDDAIEQRATWSKEQMALRQLARAVAKADACLGTGDAQGAVDALDHLVVWEAREVQSLARRAEAHLQLQPGSDYQLIRKAIALASFCEAHGNTRILHRRNAPIPSGKWPNARLDALAVRARDWLEANFGAIPKQDQVETDLLAFEDLIP